jgi:hypothetical protein
MINFKCALPEVVKSYPMQKANILNLKWYQKALIDLKKTPKNEIHTARCPGIISVNNLGWCLVNYQDIEIKTWGHDREFTWKSEIDQKKLLGYNYIHYHNFDQLKKFKDFRKDTLHTLIKIQSPWFVTIPEGYSLLCIPIPYHDDIRFTAATGILKGMNDLNAQLFWHVKNGTEIIKKGTLLAQYILLKNEEVDHTISVATDEDLKIRRNHKELWKEKRGVMI